MRAGGRASRHAGRSADQPLYIGRLGHSCWRAGGEQALVSARMRYNKKGIAHSQSSFLTAAAQVWGLHIAHADQVLC
jgi:hypothetical protein